MNIAALIPGLTPIIDRLVGLIPDPNARAQAAAAAKSELLGALTTVNAGQLQVNLAEASSGSLFMGGWRPMIGWVCAFSLAYQYLGRPIATAIFDAMGWRLPYLPGLDEHLWELMFLMLGMGGLRSLDKRNGA